MHASHRAPGRPFEHLMMDFIELTPAEGNKYCLVIVDMWSKLVKAFPAKHQRSQVVAKTLLTEIIPWWGIPAKLSSDSGSHFVNSAVTQASEFLATDLRQHCILPSQWKCCRTRKRHFKIKVSQMLRINATAMDKKENEEKVQSKHEALWDSFWQTSNLSSRTSNQDTPLLWPVWERRKVIKQCNLISANIAVKFWTTLITYI